MSVQTWLCTPNKTELSRKCHQPTRPNAVFETIKASTKFAFFLLILSAQVNGIQATATTTKAKTITSSASLVQQSDHLEFLRPQQQQQPILLSDEIEHESEFMASASNQPHTRRKRLIWITDDGRLALPPGTSLTFTPTIALPLVRHPPEGFFSNMSISFPVTIDFDKLGLTDNQNPLGDLPPLFARSFGREAGRMLGNYVARYLHYKRRRDIADELPAPKNAAFNIKRDRAEMETELPELPERFKHIFHGGERVILYGVVEDFLSTFGMDGKACLLRTICEVHSRNLEHFGVFGEMVKLFLTVSKSPFADLIPEYVKAQDIGEGRIPPAECYPYYKACPKSIFKALQNHKYSKAQNGEYREEKVEEVLTYRPLPQQRDSPLKDIEPSLNEILDHEDSKPQQFLSM